MAEQLGGSVSSSDKREFGHASIRLEGESILLSALGSAETDQDVWMSHGDKVTRLPASFKVIASSDSAPIAAMECEEKRLMASNFIQK